MRPGSVSNPLRYWPGKVSTSNVGERWRRFSTGGGPLALPDPEVAPAAALSGLRSSSTDAKFGAELTGKLLQGLGVPIPGAEVQASLWKGASEFSFQVNDVEESSVNVGALGLALMGKTLNTENPAAIIFIPPSEARMHIVTRTLASPHITVRAKDSKGQSLDIGVDAIADVLGEASARVKWKIEADGAISFQGDAATFAFAAVPCKVQEDRTLSLGLEIRDVSYQDVPGADEGPIVVATHLPLVNGDGLLRLDEAESRIGA